MAKRKSSIEEKKAYAKILYTREQLNGKIVAARVGVAEKTISKWVNEGGWKDLRNRLLVSKENQINLLYGQLEQLNQAIKDSDTKYPDTKQADIQVKVTAAIRSLETDMNIADLVEAGIRFVKFIQKVGTFDEVQETIDLWNSFLQNEMK
jgi:transposase